MSETHSRRERNSVKPAYLRAVFYWAFIQTSNARLRITGSREKLVGVLTQGELTLPIVKRVLTMICHRVEASRPTGYLGIEGLLQFLGSVMTLAGQNLPSSCLDATKEFMISRLNPLRVMCMTSVTSDVRDGKPA